jgi:Outer membrane protein beta-barrel domain
MLQRILILGAILLSSAYARAQVVPDAAVGNPLVTVGGYFSFFDADYAANQVAGPGAFIDWSPPRFFHLGLEGEGRWLNLNGANSFSEYNYLVGPRYRIPVSWRRLRPYAKVMVGAGEVNFPYHLGYGSYFAIAPGGGVDYDLRPRWKLRADYEYQFWPSAPGIPGISSGALKPNGVSAGISFQIF